MRKNFIKRYAGILLVVLMLVSMLYTDTSITSAAGEYVYGTGGSSVITDGAANVTGDGSVITDGAANVTGDGSVITDGAVNVTGNGSVITDGAVNVTGGSVTEVTNDSSVSYTPPVLDEAEEPKKAYNTPVWTGDVDEKFAGKGTKTAPYLIYTPEEFAGMLVTSKENSGAYYKLMNDIDLGGKPLRSNNPDGEWGGCNWGKLEFKSFNGHFDGNYCLISGFYQKTEYQEKSGVFRYIDSGASVENVILTGRNDCGSAFAKYTGGVIKNCTNYVDCNGGSGFVDEAGDSSIEYCYNYGTITSESCAAGIVGKLYRTSSISNCINYGEIVQIGESDYFNKACAGGIVAKGTSYYDIKYCYNLGNVSSVEKAGGICGECSLNITNCYNEGEITGQYSSGIGNIENSSCVIECINKGKVISYSGCAYGISAYGDYKGEVNKSYSICEFEAPSNNAYGISNSNISNCYHVGNAKVLNDNYYEALYSKIWEKYPTDGIIDINGGDFEYYEINELSKLQKGFPVLSWEADSFDVDKLIQRSVGLSTIDLVWAPVARATGYEIYRCDKQNGEMKLLATVNSTLYKDIDLESDKQYMYKVRSYRTENGYTYFGDFSKVLKVSTDAENNVVSEFMAGDVNCDGKVDLNDARTVLKISLGIDVEILEQGMKNANYDENDKIDLNDAKYTLKEALGIKFTVGK